MAFPLSLNSNLMLFDFTKGSDFDIGVISRGDVIHIIKQKLYF